MTTTLLTHPLAERRFRTIAAVASLLARVSRGGYCTERRFRFLRLLLESLPLGSATFQKATDRLNNSRRYLDQGESGAAGYELQMLLRSLALND